MKYDRSKGTLVTASIFLLIFLVYALVIALFVRTFGATAIVSLVFAVIAFAVAIIIPRIAFNRDGLEAVFFGIPILGLGLYYFIAEIFLSAVFITFQKTVNWKIALLVQVIALVIFVIVTIVGVSAQRTAQNVSEERKFKASVRGIQEADISALAAMAQTMGMDSQLVSALNHLSETVKYSDPFHADHPYIIDVDSRILASINTIRNAINVADAATAATAVGQTEALYVERRQKLLALK